MDHITQSQSAYRLPTYGQSIDWSFIRTKEQYLQFRADWKRVYAEMSRLRKVTALSDRCFQSRMSKPEGSEHFANLKASLDACKHQPEPFWLQACIIMAKTKSYSVPPTKAFKCQKGMTHINLTGADAVCRWLLDMRLQSKVVSQNNWLLDHPTSTS